MKNLTKRVEKNAKLTHQELDDNFEHCLEKTTLVDGKADTATNKANTAQSTANIATNKANTAQSKADSAYNLPRFGAGQIYVDVTEDRASNVTFTNNTDKPIQVIFTNNYSNNFFVDGVKIGFMLCINSYYLNTFTVPVGSTYKIDGTFGAGFCIFAELR